MFAWARRAAMEVAGVTVAPWTCPLCGRPLCDGDRAGVCVDCSLRLPWTHIATADFSPIHQRLALGQDGPRPHRAASMIYYERHGDSSLLVRQAKYQGLPRTVQLLGRAYADVLRQAGWFQGMDVVLPVPMHWAKRLRRGHNQAQWLARGVAQGAGLPLGDNLYAARRRRPQASLGAAQRHANMHQAIGVRHPSELAGLEVLVVDDVITTGATMRACLQALAQSPAPPRAVSVLSLALTKTADFE